MQNLVTRDYCRGARTRTTGQNPA